MDKQTEISIKNKWKYIISPFTDRFPIAGVCCLVTSHCPPHFQMFITLETINKSMARAAGPDSFRGKGESGPLTQEVELNWDVTAISNASAGRFKGVGLFKVCAEINLVRVKGSKTFLTVRITRLPQGSKNLLTHVIVRVWLYNTEIPCNGRNNPNQDYLGIFCNSSLNPINELQRYAGVCVAVNV